MRRKALVMMLFSLLTAVGLHAALPLERRGVSLPSGFTLWLPPQTSVEGEILARTELESFDAAWSLYFGQPAPLPPSLEVLHSPNLAAAIFDALWRAASPALAHSEKANVLAAFRHLVLRDRSALKPALEAFVVSGRLDERLLDGPLVYVFLQEEVADASFLAQSLPPGKGGAGLRAALESRGVSWNSFWNRFSSWVLARAVESGLLPTQAAALPAVWILDRPLPPGGFSSWKFSLEEPDGGVDLESSTQPAPGLRLLSFYTDADGRVVQQGLAPLSLAPVLLPKQGAVLWIVVWNAGAQEAGDGLVLTAWTDFAAPFHIRSASLEDQVCDLSLSERAGVANYQLWSRPDADHSFELLPVPAFLSDGAGDHRYRVTLPSAPPEGTEFQLSCRTAGGGTYASPLRIEGSQR
jgi:hypothetical protein